MELALLSAPLLQCTRSFWEARMVLPASPEAGRPQQCNVCERSVLIQATTSVGIRATQAAQMAAKDPQPASDLYVVEGIDISPVDQCRRCSRG